MTSATAVSAPPAAARWDALRRHRRLLLTLAVVALLAEMAVVMVRTAVAQTPTIDEPVYVGTSVVYLQQHSLRYNPEHPPLGKLIIGIGPAFARPRLDPAFKGPQEAVGQHLLYESGNDARQLMLLARLPVIVLTLLFGLVVFAFAADLVGRVGGLVALGLYAFSPDVIANGSLATLDVPAAGFMLTSVWLLWRARRRPLLYLPLSGSALGAALATKMNMLVAVPVLLGLVVVSVWSADREGIPALPRAESGPALPRARLLGLGVAAAVGVAVVAVAVVWASYLAVDPRLRWTAPAGAPPAGVPHIGGLRGLVIDWLPFPKPYGDGMRVQFGLEDSPWRGFLFGRSYKGALWYYLPAALLVKTPLGMLALWPLGAVALLAVRRLRPAAPYLLIPTAVLLAGAMTGSRNFGTRYAIFVPMFLAVAAAGVVAFRARWAPVAAGVLVAVVAASSLRTYPFYLPYSNEAFGGPSKTHLRLHDSNVDWGQDLGRLADHLKRRYPGEPVWLAYKGSGVPSYYGIRASDALRAPQTEVSGLLVISDSWLAKGDPRVKRLLKGSRAIDEVGHSMTIYRRAVRPASPGAGAGGVSGGAAGRPERAAEGASYSLITPPSVSIQSASVSSNQSPPAPR